MLVSIIVPVYKGKYYLERLIHMVENNAELSQKMCEVELIFINDYPDEQIEDFTDKGIVIKVINTKINRGIHGARVEGLNYASGEYIVFLDQDDIIMDNYIISQLTKIGNYDAVICNLKRNENNNRSSFQKIPEQLTVDYILNTFNPIVSPGQVLIKRTAISDYWVSNTLSYNGADDWMLWILMIHENRLFMKNNEILLGYSSTGMNTSDNISLMAKSEMEILKLFKTDHILKDSEEKEFEKLLEKRNIERYINFEKTIKIASLYRRWIGIKRKCHSIGKYLSLRNISDVSIYGAGEVGKELKSELEFEGIKVVCFIDSRAEEIKIIEDVPVLTLDKYEDNADEVIISVARKSDVFNIKNSFHKRGIDYIESLEEIFDKMDAGDD